MNNSLYFDLYLHTKTTFQYNTISIFKQYKMTFQVIFYVVCGMFNILCVILLIW